MLPSTAGREARRYFSDRLKEQLSYFVAADVRRLIQKIGNRKSKIEYNLVVSAATRA
jgi:hypothetical protein